MAPEPGTDTLEQDMVQIRSQAITNLNLNLLLEDQSLPMDLLKRREGHHIKSINLLTKKHHLINQGHLTDLNPITNQNINKFTNLHQNLDTN